MHNIDFEFKLIWFLRQSCWESVYWTIVQSIDTIHSISIFDFDFDLFIFRIFRLIIKLEQWLKRRVVQSLQSNYIYIYIYNSNRWFDFDFDYDSELALRSDFFSFGTNDLTQSRSIIVIWYMLFNNPLLFLHS